MKDVAAIYSVSHECVARLYGSKQRARSPQSPLCYRQGHQDMVAIAPHYLLLIETHCHEEGSAKCGSWRFLLRQVDGTEVLEVTDLEPSLSGERLQLFAAIRGLEAIGQPSRVTLVTSSQYVMRGIRRDLNAWREMNWTWERFGELHPIKNRDLWRRLDHAIQFHHVQCRSWRLSAGEPEDRFISIRDVGLRTTTSVQQTINRFGQVPQKLIEGWVKLARRIGSRNTVESWAASH